MKRPFAVLIVVSLMTISAHAADEVVRLHALFDRTWETNLKERPMFATPAGRQEYDDRLGSSTMADLERRNAQEKATLAELKAIERSKLTPEEMVNYDIFEMQIENGIASFELGDY